MKRGLFREFHKYLGVGVLNMLVGLSVIYLAKWLFKFDDVAANALGYGVGLCVSFTLNRQWTFSHDGAAWPAFGKFLLVAALSYAVNLMTVVIAIQWLAINSYVAQALGIPPYTLTSYILSKFFVFRRSVP